MYGERLGGSWSVGRDFMERTGFVGRRCMRRDWMEGEELGGIRVCEGTGRKGRDWMIKV